MTDHRAAVFAQVSGLPAADSGGLVQVSEFHITEAAVSWLYGLIQNRNERNTKK